eukprot:GILK01001264.1.p1 GENE.GILK01001264.1~~GILK01001264.1.p1  ORF type:complete len:468 (+),score=65.89 GILK01001264.1:56-1405(+)
MAAYNVDELLACHNPQTAQPQPQQFFFEESFPIPMLLDIITESISEPNVVPSYPVQFNSTTPQDYPDFMSTRFTREQWRLVNIEGERLGRSYLFAASTAEFFFDALDETGCGSVSLREFHNHLQTLASDNASEKAKISFRFYGGRDLTLQKNVATTRALAVFERVNSLGFIVNITTVMQCLSRLFQLDSQVTFHAFMCVMSSHGQVLASALGLFAMITNVVVQPQLVARSAPYINNYARPKLEICTSPTESLYEETHFQSPNSFISGGYEHDFSSPISALAANEVPNTPPNSRSPFVNASTPVPSASPKKRKRTEAYPEGPWSTSPYEDGKNCPRKGNDDCACKSCVRIRRNRASAREAQRKKKEALENIGHVRARLAEMEELYTVSQTQNAEMQGLLSASQTRLEHVEKAYLNTQRILVEHSQACQCHARRCLVNNMNNMNHNNGFNN